MPNHSKYFVFILSAVMLVFSQPGEAQNRGVRGMGSSRRSAPAVRSAPAARSAPARSAPARSYSAPRSSAPSRSYSAPRSSGSSRSYSAPRTSSRSYSAPTVRQTVAMPSSRTSNSSYRSASRPSVSIPTNSGNSGSSVRVTGYAPRATYPGRVNGTAARVSPSYTPGYTYSNTNNSGALSNGAVRGYTGNTSTTVRGSVPNTSNQASQVVRMPNGTTATTAVPNYSNSALDGGRVMGYGPRTATVRNPANPPVQVPPPNYTNNNYYNYNNGNCQPRQSCSSRYYDCYDPYIYSDYSCRRAYRYYQPCYYPFLSLGFFVTRPYAYYDYARIDYAQPFVYGDDDYYRSAPVIDNQVASTQPTAPVSMEQEMLSELSRYVDANSKDGRFLVADPAFGNQMWSLDLTQAPAVYSIDSNHYSVVGGFEGTLGTNTIPSSVGLEFFVAREGGRWAIKEAWIVSANGIPRAKKFQSPTYPQVQTWQSGAVCPFTGQPMVPITQTPRG